MLVSAAPATQNGALLKGKRKFEEKARRNVQLQDRLIIPILSQFWAQKRKET